MIKELFRLIGGHHKKRPSSLRENLASLTGQMAEVAAIQRRNASPFPPAKYIHNFSVDVLIEDIYESPDAVDFLKAAVLLKLHNCGFDMNFKHNYSDDREDHTAMGVGWGAALKEKELQTKIKSEQYSRFACFLQDLQNNGQINRNEQLVLLELCDSAKSISFIRRDIRGSFIRVDANARVDEGESAYEYRVHYDIQPEKLKLLIDELSKTDKPDLVAIFRKMGIRPVSHPGSNLFVSENHALKMQ